MRNTGPPNRWRGSFVYGWIFTQRREISAGRLEWSIFFMYVRTYFKVGREFQKRRKVVLTECIYVSNIRIYFLYGLEQSRRMWIGLEVDWRW